MYFMPVLIGVCVLLLYPSLILGVGVALATWLYLRYAGMKVSSTDIAAIRGQLAFRVLSVKLLSYNGSTDDKTFEVHALVTSDFVENSDLRSQLRDAAAATPEQWEPAARTVRTVYRDAPEDLQKRLDGLIVQVSAQPCGVTDATQLRLMEIAKMWRIGPKQTRDLLLENHVNPSPALLAWR